MPQITVFGGAGGIGGNQILVEDARGAFLLDFGTPYERRNQLYGEHLRPRSGFGLLDSLTMGLLPPLAGLYRSDLESGPRLWPSIRNAPGYRRLEQIEGVLLSHAHLDHAGYVSFLREDTPVYASLMTSILLKAIQDVSGSDLEREVTSIAPRETRDGYLVLQQKDGQRKQRPYTFLLTQNDSAVPQGQPVRPFPETLQFWNTALGPQTSAGGEQTIAPKFLPQRASFNGRGLQHYPVDHSVLGATGLAVETSEGWVVYTGDLRFHGSQPGLMREFVEGVAALRPLALICEGTHTEPGVQSRTEADVLQSVLRVVREEKRLVVADFSVLDMERLLSFFGVAELSGRKLAITMKDAYLLEAMGKAWRQFPKLAEVDALRVYDETHVEPQPVQFDARSAYGSLLVGPEEVRSDPGAYILCLGPRDLPHLVDLRPQGGLWIRSSSEAESEQERPDVERLQAWLGHFGMRSLGLPRRNPAGKWEAPAEEQGVSASGHASFDELVSMIEEVRPRYLVPVHTERPWRFSEALKRAGIEVRVPEGGVSFRLG